MKRVVITGMGALTPVGNSVREFGESIFAGRHGIGQITRFDTTDFKVKIAAEVKGFDPSSFLEKSDIRRNDLYTQFALFAAKQAMEDSGLVSGENISSDRLGVYVGSGTGGIQTFLDETRKYIASGSRKISPFFIPMMISNMAAGMIAIKHGANGPTLPVVTACATSSNTLGEAFRAIKHGYADAIIAGGSEAAINEMGVGGFINCMALTQEPDPNQASIPFDARRNGFVIGEGAAVLILEEYEHAAARGAQIYAEIAGYGNTCDAHHITAPHPEAEFSSRCMINAMEEAGITPSDRVYVNAHGTSTPLNDKTETLAIKKAFGYNTENVLVSSTKSMTGHMLGAAGAVEAVVGVLALSRGEIPPTAGYSVPDPDCDLDFVPNEKRVWQADFVLSNSLGFGGHNATIALRRV